MRDLTLAEKQATAAALMATIMELPPLLLAEHKSRLLALTNGGLKGLFEKGGEDALSSDPIKRLLEDAANTLQGLFERIDAMVSALEWLATEEPHVH